MKRTAYCTSDVKRLAVKQPGLYLFTVQQFRDERSVQEDGEGRRTKPQNDTSVQHCNIPLCPTYLFLYVYTCLHLQNFLSLHSYFASKDIGLQVRAEKVLTSSCLEISTQDKITT